MDDKEFREFGKAAVDYVADYHENLRDRDVLPSVQPGFLRKLLPTEAPEKPDTWRQVLEDVERYIMTGVSHWLSPHFHAYFPAGSSYPAIVGEIISAGISSVGFSWIASPAATELELITMDWLAKLLGLPEKFLNSSPGPGGGILQGSASEATLIGLLAARERTVKRLKNENPDWDEATIRSKLVSYTSDQANSSVERSGLLGAVLMRLLPTNAQRSLRGVTLLEAIKKDIEAGLIPCYVVATWGTTPTCAFDSVDELGPICNEYNIWLHVDAAYAGAALICPEHRYLMPGLEYVDSFNFNPHKWLLINFDCSAHWVKNTRELIEPFNVQRTYLEHDKEGVTDYRHWQIPLGRRFRALKVWFVLRLYGVEGLQKHIRHAVQLAKNFKDFMSNDDRFEIVAEVKLGLVCFKLKGDNDLTKQLLDRLMIRRRIYVVPEDDQDTFFIRFVIGSHYTVYEDIVFAWNEISGQASEVLRVNPKYITAKAFDVFTKKNCFEEVSRIEGRTWENKLG